MTIEHPLLKQDFQMNVDEALALQIFRHTIPRWISRGKRETTERISLSCIDTLVVAAGKMPGQSSKAAVMKK
jgi:hypothetical protein